MRMDVYGCTRARVHICAPQLLTDLKLLRQKVAEVIFVFALPRRPADSFFPGQPLPFPHLHT